MSVSAPFRSLELKRIPKAVDATTAESHFWQSFATPKIQKQIAPVSFIDVCPQSPFDFAITCSTRIHVYDGQTCTLKKTFSRFTDVVYSGTFRSDGKLMVAGCQDSSVTVLDMNTRSILRQFKGHTNAVRATSFASDNTHILSCSDDKTVRYWDLPTQKPISIMTNHKDYVRCLSQSPSSNDLWATGSYDHTVKLWDLRQPITSTTNSMLSVDHGDPIECCLMLPGNSLFLSAGNNTIKVWDLLNGGKLLQSFSNHQKTITNICLDGTNTRLISSGLDGHVKFYDLKTFEVTHGLKVDSGLLSVNISPNNQHLIMGTMDQQLITRHRQLKKSIKFQEECQQYITQDIIRGGTSKFFLRGRNSKPSTGDKIIETTKHKRLTPYDKALRKFRYKEALDKALETNSPLIVASLLEELRYRDGLRRAFSQRNEITLEPLLSFVVHYIMEPRYSRLLITVAHILFDLYFPMVGKSVIIDDLFLKLHQKIKKELNFHSQALGLLGAMDSLMTAQTCTQKPRT